MLGLIIYHIIRYYLYYQKIMLKKGDLFLNHVNNSKKKKMYTEPNQLYNENNKENLVTKSLLEHLDESNQNNNHQKIQISDPAYYGSIMVSPTFQTQEVISLKDEKFRADKNYLNVNFSLKDVNKKMEDYDKIKKQAQQKAKQNGNGNDQLYKVKIKQIQQLKRRLTNHYQNKKYWKKIQKLFEQEGVDAVIAWQDAIDKYKIIKDQNKQYQQQLIKLSSLLQQKQQKINTLEKQMAQDKNQTKILSIKKCKGCQNLQQKEKEHYELYENNKKNQKYIDELKENVHLLSEQLKISEQKYQNIKHLKQQLQKKNAKLIEKEKQLTHETQKLQKILKEDNSNSKQLHIQKQKQKQAKHQLQKALNKMDQKFKRQILQLQEDIKYKAQQIQSKQNLIQKLKNQLSAYKQKLSKLQLDYDSIDEEMKIKNVQSQDAKKRYIQNMNEQLRKKNELAQILKNKEEELKKSYQNQDEMQNIKVSLQLQLNKEVKLNLQRIEIIKSHEDYIKQLQQKLKQFQDQEYRIKQAHQIFNQPKNNKNYQNISNVQTNQLNNQNNILFRKISSKIKQIYNNLTDFNNQNQDPYQKKKIKDELSQERQGINLLKAQKYLAQINTQISNFINKYNYMFNQNQTLKKQLQFENSYKQQEQQQFKKQIQLKQDAIKCIAPFIPEQLKQIAIQFLQFTDKLSLDNPDQSQYEQYEELKDKFQYCRRQWKQNNMKMDKRFRKMEEEIQRLRDENQQLRRKNKGKDIKRQVMTDYDERQVFSKKNIGKKYNIGN